MTSESISSVMEKAFKKVLPIPKTPRVYHPPPPAKPLSWIPNGTIGNVEYENKLADFAKVIKALDAERSKSVRYSSRGWCYLLEGLRKIDKGQFPACQNAINNCRKLGLLPIDFVAEDQDETRHFKGIIEASDPSSALEDMKIDVEKMIGDFSRQSTDYWADEKYYVMMCVEKGDLLSLFKPVCDEYHVPIVSSKGWAPILLRSHIANLAQRAEANGLTAVLLLFYDHDPAGLKISNTFQKNLEDCKGGTGWSPDILVIDRFGLNKKDIDKYGLMWIDNLKTGSGRDATDYEYIHKFGERKCESNALFKNDKTLEAGRQICKEAIEKYYGKDALDRFTKKEMKFRKKFSLIRDNPVWTTFNETLGDMIKTLNDQEEKGEKETEEEEDTTLEKERIVYVDETHYGRCPKCGCDFNYDSSMIGKLVRCRNCQRPLRLRKQKYVDEAT